MFDNYANCDQLKLPSSFLSSFSCSVAVIVFCNCRRCQHSTHLKQNCSCQHASSRTDLYDDVVDVTSCSALEVVEMKEEKSCRHHARCLVPTSMYDDVVDITACSALDVVEIKEETRCRHHACCLVLTSMYDDVVDVTSCSALDVVEIFLFLF